jgi:hypothetical protein
MEHGEVIYERSPRASSLASREYQCKNIALLRPECILNCVRSLALVARLPWAAWLLSSLGCVPDRTIFLPGGDASAVVLFVRDEAGGISAYAASVGSESPTRVPLTGQPHQADLYALLYQCPLDGLRLVSGPVALTINPASGWPIQRPAQILSARLDGNRSVEWSPAEAPEWLLGLAYAGPASDRCVEFVATPIALSPLRSPRIVAPMGDGVFITTDAGQFARVDKSGPALITTLTASTPHAGAWQGPDGTIWLAGGGVLARGTPDLGFSTVSSTQVLSGDRLWISGPRSSTDAFELFVLTQSRHIVRFDGNRWTRLYAGAGASLGEGGSIWLGPGSMIAAGMEPLSVVYVHDGVAEEVQVPSADGASLVSSGYVDGMGAVLGSRTGWIYFGGPSNWKRAQVDPATGPEIRAITKLDDGALVGARTELFAQFHSEGSVCAAQSLTSTSSLVRTIVGLANGSFATAVSNPSAGTGAIVFFDRTRPAPSPACAAGPLSNQ